MYDFKKSLFSGKESDMFSSARKIGILLVLFLSTIAVTAEDFISEFEYGQMLYQNPRGVSCAPCHGDRGQGADIARYRTKRDKEVTLRGPDIRSSTLKTITEAVKKGPGVMPRYFLTKEEIHAIYTYIREAKEREKESE